MRRRFVTLDVFTADPFAGNPLAVVFDGDGLDPARMQAIAREFNLSETVFVLEPRDPINTARLRIFTPTAELPFAGHPTLGAALAIAEDRAPELAGRQELQIVLEEAVGDIVCLLAPKRQGRALRARFTLPHLPQPLGPAPASELIASALGLEPADIGFDTHRPVCFSAGVPMMFVPLASRAALARATAEPAHWRVIDESNAPAVFLYTPEVDAEHHAFAARMFAPRLGIAEDPATGAAVAALAGVIATFDQPADGWHELVIGQGADMGRPSEIVLGLAIENGVLAAVTLGGAAIRVQEGVIEA